MSQVTGQSSVHESALEHLTGRAVYTDDALESSGTLYCAPVMSPHAHARLLALDANLALALPGVVSFVSASDIPGHNSIGPILQDEPLLPDNLVQYRGQVVGVVVARSVLAARQAARQVKMEWEVLPAILTIDQAIQAQQFVLKTLWPSIV
jgi:xanthine dehydrogenase large subunit